jgi:hypothetical protein
MADKGTATPGPYEALEEFDFALVLQDYLRSQLASSVLRRNAFESRKLPLFCSRRRPTGFGALFEVAQLQEGLGAFNESNPR